MDETTWHDDGAAGRRATPPRGVLGWLPSPGRSLELLAVAHVAVGAVLHRRALEAVVRSGVVGTVGDHGPRATGWWFLAAAPLLWSTGRLLRAVDGGGDRAAQRAAGAAIAAVGTAGGVVMPTSPLWLVAATGVRVVRRSRATAVDPPVPGPRAVDGTR